MDKLWSIQVMEYYSELKRKKLESHEQIWRKLQCILLSEKNLSGKATYCMIPIHGILEKAKLGRQ